MKTKKIKVNSKIYKENVVFKTIDILSNKYLFKVKLDKDNNFIVQISLRYSGNRETIDSEKEFFDHLNNQKIRELINKETRVIKELIVSKALFETQAFDNEKEHFMMSNYNPKENFQKDPNRIAEPFIGKAGDH